MDKAEIKDDKEKSRQRDLIATELEETFNVKNTEKEHDDSLYGRHRGGWGNYEPAISGQEESTVQYQPVNE